MKASPAPAHTNELIHESSPYLLQHAHNPVDWLPWGQKALQKAQKENKLLIISIGYSACHWCHVMEHESFEDSVVANLMNKYYVPVKVDREEHPDVDKIYMSAVQKLTGRGGWPLNVVALPDGRPVWGGTYFPKANWMSALEQIADMWQKHPDKLQEIARQVEQGIKAGEIIQPNNDTRSFTEENIRKSLSFWKTYKDNQYGGFKRAPKFPMPAQYQYLLRAGLQLNDPEIVDFVKLSLDKMAQGGIYDPVNGGFARYSTDKKWHIPHFEKMLYDNALLVSLYCDAYKVFKEESYKKVVDETLDFVARELSGNDGVFYSSLDADSLLPDGKLEEGAYYVFTREELEKTIGSDFPLFKVYYNINAYGLWEDDKYHLIKKMSDKEFVKQYNIDRYDLEKKVQGWKQKLFALRQKRARPQLDNKSLTSWNALMLKAYVDAYHTFGKKQYLTSALRNAEFILQQQLKPDGSLWHSYKNGKSRINGLLEDYAFTISAFIHLYEASGLEKYIQQADDLTQYALQHFYEPRSGMFYFNDAGQNHLLTRPVETDDNVIPSSNAVMADNLLRLGHFYEKKDYIDKSRKMLHNILPKMEAYAPGYYRWSHDMLDHLGDFYEIAVCGEAAPTKAGAISARYIPNKILAFSTTASQLPLLKERYIAGKTYIYLCVDNACRLPVENVEEVLDFLKWKLY